MNKEIIAPDPMFGRVCLHCYNKLGLREQIMLKFKKKCRCGHCGKIIDERFKVY